MPAPDSSIRDKAYAPIQRKLVSGELVADGLLEQTSRGAVVAGQPERAVPLMGEHMQNSLRDPLPAFHELLAPPVCAGTEV